MFLDNRQVAMDSLLEALADSLDYYQDNVERLRDSVRDALTPWFNQRTADLKTLQTQCKTHLDLLPRDADVERDDYMWLWSRLKSFVGDDSQVLINELLEQERVLMQSLSTAFTHDLPEDIDKTLERLWSDCRSLIRELYRQQKKERGHRPPKQRRAGKRQRTSSGK
ncbi:hypothetical protein [Larsenimonas rhizosphaerae]|uniref:Uncharacterized protein n=1 Tax=Larsenimonas rhizosphaerae TaxID=2944682 RepID=A0AA42CY50_9GAMM|nr:hypothetical protein [Larsenimonas rhizosphaerae]MCM2132072.1 hypothetical protein [Larsenimonas rhizosphaerae]MCX2524675.1 hypothetical protein [Larsenimonas rhizosphaerae]